MYIYKVKFARTMALHNIAFTVITVIMFSVAAALPTQGNQEKTTMIDFEERIRNLEKTWSMLDLQLQQGAGKLDLLHEKLDRLETLMNAKVDGAGEKLQAHALQVQIAAERAATACNRLHHKLHTTTLNTQNESKDPNNQFERRPIAMQQDSATTFSKEASTITAKISNMYNELWRRSIILEGLTKDSMELTNATRRETQDGFRSLMLQLTKRNHLPSVSSTPTSASILQHNTIKNMENTINVIQRRLSDSNHKMDTKFQEVMLKQDLFLDSCHRIQLNEPQLVSEITRVLDKLLLSLINKTSVTFDELQNIKELIKSHDTHIARAVARVNNAALLSGKENKNLAEIINNMNNDCQQESQKNHHDFNDKFNIILSSLQELKDQAIYAEDQIDKSVDTEIIMENIKNEFQSAIANKYLSENISLICKDKRDEIENIINKLGELVDKLQNPDEEFEEYFRNDPNSRESEETEENEIKKKHKALHNITKPEELINRLYQIQFESSQDVSIEKNPESEILKDDGFSHLKEPTHRGQFYTTESPKMQKQKQRIQHPY